MKETCIELREDDGDHWFAFETNHLNPFAGWTQGQGGCLFEPYGAELAYIRRQDPARVWTLVEGGRTGLQLLSGYHTGNRLGFLLCRSVTPPGLSFKIHLKTDFEYSPRAFSEAA